MKSGAILRRLSLALTFAATSLSAQNQTGRANVVVVDRAGQPVVGATVFVTQSTNIETGGLDLSAPPLANGATDSTGQVSVEWSAVRAPMVVVAARGYRTTARPVSSIATPFVLEPGRDVPFSILDGQVPIRGTVTWSAVDPRAGTPDVQLTIASDDRGSGILTGLAGEPVLVTVHASLRSVQQRVELLATDISLKLPAAAVLEGRTVDEEGQPLADVAIDVTGLRSPGRMTSGLDGRFRVSNLATGLFRLEFTKASRMTETLEASVEVGQVLVLPPVVMPRGLRVSATFKDVGTGQPISNARVIRESNELSGFDTRELTRAYPPFVGGADGRVIVDGLSAGIVRLALDTPSYARTRVAELDLKEDTGDVDLGDILVGPGATLAVRVRDRHGDPRANTSIRLDQGPAISPLREVSATTDADGSASIDRLGRGSYRVRIGGNGFATGPPELAAEWLTIDGDVQKEFVVGGVNATLSVLFGGQPLPYASVTIAADSPATESRGAVATMSSSAGVRALNGPLLNRSRGQTDADGRVTLQDVFVGPSKLSIALPGGGMFTQPFETNDDVERTIEIPTRRISTQALDASNRQPVRIASAVWTSISNASASAAAGPDGTIVLEGLQDGPGELRVSARDRYDPVVLKLADFSRIPSEMLLTPAMPVTVRLRIVSDANEPLGDASVGIGSRFLTTKANGLIETPITERSKVRLIVRRSGYVSYLRQELTLRPGINDLGSVFLKRGYRVTVSTRPPSNGVVEQYRLRVLDANGVSLDGALDDMSWMTLADGGEASVGMLSSGSYTVELVGRRGTRRARVQVQEADTQVIVP